MRTLLISMFAVMLSFQPLFAKASAIPKSDQQRVIILTDIEADPDDTQSLVRLLLYANQIDIKAIVATTSCWHKDRINPESLVKVINAYGEVRSNLNKHEAGYPTEKALLKLVKNSIPKYGMEGVGKGKDTEGSNCIIKELENDDERPLWISTWGGVNTLAQALHTIRETKTEAEAAKMIAKLRVYTISDQDDSGIWIRNTFPGVFYIVSPGDYYGSATWNAINHKIEGINNDVISNKWLKENLQTNHGPLGAQYPDVAWGVEGDTPAFLALIPNGLNAPEHPNWGGWAGRYELYKPALEVGKEGSSSSGVPLNVAEKREIWTDTKDNYIPYYISEFGRLYQQRDKEGKKLSFNNDKEKIAYNDNAVTLWRWREDFQNDFAARMDWCTQSYKNANHPPVPVLMHPEEITVKSGAGFALEAFDSYDPDGDSLSFLWFHYPEVGSYKELIKIGGAENVHHVHVEAPKVDKKETAHFILKLTDKGEPPLTRYKRVIVTIEP